MKKNTIFIVFTLIIGSLITLEINNLVSKHFTRENQLLKIDSFSSYEREETMYLATSKWLDKEFSLDEEFSSNVKRYSDERFHQIPMLLALSFKESSYRNIVTDNVNETSIGYFQLNMETVKGLSKKFKKECPTIEELKSNVSLQFEFYFLLVDYLDDKFPDDSQETFLRRYNAGEYRGQHTAQKYVDDILNNLNRIMASYPI